MHTLMRRARKITKVRSRPTPRSGSPPPVEWYVNFADADLFVAYHIGLFAQDEIQTAEHPACGAIKEWMRAVGAEEDKVAERSTQHTHRRTRQHNYHNTRLLLCVADLSLNRRSAPGRERVASPRLCSSRVLSAAAPSTWHQMQRKAGLTVSMEMRLALRMLEACRAL